ncbi:MAG: TIGR03862 family flavoprotein [Sterolibacterium sp.]|nr:TIGR03862 family flavoprotein [Sterolibacterium sp.]
MSDSVRLPSIAVIGAGPAGLMAAETLIAGGLRVDLYDAMPSVARKFLQAGKGGLNLTHSEPFDLFLSRYGTHRDQIAPLLATFGPEALRDWARGLGIETFVGSSGRVFPSGMKAAPLLRAWLQCLRLAGLRIHVRHRWCGWDESEVGHGLRFSTPGGECLVFADVVVLALGGGSWARLGSDGAWVPLLLQRGIPVAPLLPANCGFDVSAAGWSEHFRARFAGQPVKPVSVSFTDSKGVAQHRQGEFVVTATGVEGSLIYALSASLRDEIAATGCATIHLDLAPGWALSRVIEEVSRPRGSRSISSHLQSRLGIKGVKTGLLRELLAAEDFVDPVCLGTGIKHLPLRLHAARPLDEAISSAGGVVFESLDERLMLRSLPGVFCAGEMLDWEAPTGGYLLTACFASGRAAGLGVMAWIEAESTAKQGFVRKQRA